MRHRKTQYDLSWRSFYGLPVDQAGARFWQIAAQHATYVDQGTAPANHALVVGAVADDLTIGAQHSVLQRNGIEPPCGGSAATYVGTCHHRTSGLTTSRNLSRAHSIAKQDSLFVRWMYPSTRWSGAQQQSSKRFLLESEKETPGFRHPELNIQLISFQHPSSVVSRVSFHLI